ncbi:MAG TPA: MmcQ/YjbR family DNA-binding protein [Propionibacteriaceae bacterium]
MTHPTYSAADVQSALSAVRAECLVLPEVSERLSHGSPAFFVRRKTTFVMLLDNHHGDGRLALWCAAPPGVQEDLVETEPERFFRPPYVGHRGWLGVSLLDVEDQELHAIVREAYRTVAPKALLA